MTSTNPFVLQPNEYKRDLNVVGHYTRDAAMYLHKRTGESLERCVEFVRKRVTPSHPQGIKNPDALILSRNKHGDRQKGVVPLLDYIQDVEQNDRIIAPTMTVYHNPETIPSVCSDFIEVNIAQRDVSKGEMFQAIAEKNDALATYKKNEQVSFKTSNNSMSGAHASLHNILPFTSSCSFLTVFLPCYFPLSSPFHPDFVPFHPSERENSLLCGSSPPLKLARPMKHWDNGTML